jgi:twitching motility protein PilJ
VAATGQALMQSQRLAKSVSQAWWAAPQAFPEVKESADVLARTCAPEGRRADVPGGARRPAGTVEPLLPLVDRAEKNAATVLGQQKTLTQVGQALRTINRQSSDLLETAETVSSLKLQQAPRRPSCRRSGQLVMLTQRIGKSANEFLTMEGVSPEAVFLLGKDLNSVPRDRRGPADGNPSCACPARATRRPRAPAATGEAVRGDAHPGQRHPGQPAGPGAAREAQTAIVQRQRAAAQGPRSRAGAPGDCRRPRRAGIHVAGHPGGWRACWWLAAWAAAAVRAGPDQRAQMAEAQRQEAERQEQEAKRVNDANQAAILRLMNELQTVAEGDLTQQATVTEDITGAIADSVNYTVEELRNLVSQVQGTVARVTETTQQVEQTSTELLAASTEQLREIRETGESVLQMAGRINDVSAQAQQTARWRASRCRRPRPA